LGENALRSNTSGYNNIAIGPEALRSNTTSSRNYKNIAIGADAMRYVNAESSYHNIAIGSNAIGNVNATYSQENIAIGVSALSGNNVNGLNSTQCVVIGNYAFQKAWGSGSSVVIGYSAGYNTYDGHSTVAIGHNALYSNTSGDQNTVIGQGALYSNTTGNRNVAIGVNAGSEITTGSNNICIGFDSGAESTWNNITTTSNNIIMGNNSITVARCKVAWATTSDKRDKTSFAPVPHGLEFVNALKPTAYRFKKDRDSEEPQEDSAVRYGFFAQDVLKLEGEHPVVIDNSNPDHLAYNESSLIPILVNAIKELSAELKSVKEELAKIK
jgi:hypothetical protein